jgi:fructose-1,6-bisphosphatase/inositol monophosphatase family enzyme
VDTDEILTLLREVAEEVVNPRFRSLADGEVHEKNPGDLVTDADREAEVLITRALLDAHPDAVVLGEETFASDHTLMDRYAAAPHAFTLDPVDGTKNFVHGSPDHAVMVSETVDGQAVRSWIWQPQHGRGYVAERGAGSWRHDDLGATRLTVPARDDSADASGDASGVPSGDASAGAFGDTAGETPGHPVDRAGTGAALRGRTSRRAWIGRSLGGLPPLELTWVSCGIDYPKLVEGAADYVLYARGAPWDHVPGSLLLAEAGGVLGRADGQPYSPRDTAPPGLVAAGAPTVYDRVVAALAAGTH